MHWCNFLNSPILQHWGLYRHTDRLAGRQVGRQVGGKWLLLAAAAGCCCQQLADAGRGTPALWATRATSNDSVKAGCEMYRVVWMGLV